MTSVVFQGEQALQVETTGNMVSWPSAETRPNARGRSQYNSTPLLSTCNYLLVLDRHEMRGIETRALLFMNRGDGTFEPKPTTFSGLDGSGIAAEVADLNNDGLLDLVFAADPDNSGAPRSMDRYESKIYWNSGEHGARFNHWLRLRFSGVRDAELIGARVELFSASLPSAEPSTAAKLLGSRVIASNPGYKSGGPLEAHFGLGKCEVVNIVIRLLGGKNVEFAEVKDNRILDLNLQTKEISTVETK